jgi:uncharacterized protein involved in exopolysaccharide biosynthesis
MTAAVAQVRAGSAGADEGIATRALVLLVWRSRWLVLAITAGCGIAAAIVSCLVPREYEASVLLSAVTNQSTPSGLGAIGSAVSQLGGIASLAGLNISGAAGAKAEAVATLQSEAVTERYIRDNNLLPVLFSRQWDRTLNKWNTDDPDKMPTLWKANQYFTKGVRKVTESPKTGLVLMTITWKNAALAAQWANGLVRLTNDYLRDKAIDESERNIAYLNEQAAKTGVVEVRSAIYTLMEAEIKKQMVARGSKEYALKTIDPATAPEKPTYPRPVLWTVGGVALGVLLGVLAAAVHYVLQSAPPGASRISQRELEVH